MGSLYIHTSAVMIHMLTCGRFVQYVDQDTAELGGLIGVTPRGGIYLGVDHTSTLGDDDVGRKSVRIESIPTFTQGLLVADIEHMPASVCGAWPAFWTIGENPQDGEIGTSSVTGCGIGPEYVITRNKDIIEGVNTQSSNTMTLHTAGMCTIDGKGQTGSVTTTNCSVTDPRGCSVEGLTGSFGTEFNSVDGGVYAMLWTDEAIRLWFFPRSSIPESIANGDPDPGSFGVPLANFQPSSCDLQQMINDHKVIIDTTFCGDWAAGVFTDSGCPMRDPSSYTSSCVHYVATNPSVYREAYWEINSIKIYRNQSDGDTTLLDFSSKPSAVESLTAEYTTANQTVSCSQYFTPGARIRSPV
jgi:hypothetical protein